MPKTADHHFHLSFFAADLSGPMRILYFVRVLRDLVNKCALFFFPIFLFTFGRDTFGSRWGISAIGIGFLTLALFHVLERLVIGLSAFPIGRYVTRAGHQKSMVYSHLLRALTFGLLMLVGSHPWLIVPVAILEAVQANFFWPSYYTLLSKYAHTTKLGADLGVIRFLLQLVAVLSPALAGLMALKLGFNSVFFFSIALELVSMVVTLYLPSIGEKDQISWQEFKMWLAETRFQKLGLAEAGRYVQDVILFIWPLIIFTYLKSVDRVGYLSTMVLFLSLILSLVFGSVLDRIKSRRPYQLSGGALSLLWLIRTQLTTVWGFLVVDVVDRFVSSFHWLFYDLILFRRGKGTQAYSYFLYREIMLSIYGVPVWLILGILFVLSDQFVALFIMAAIGVLLTLLMDDGKENHGKN